MFKISKSILLIAAIAFITIGATKSYFTDTETIASNTLTYGTLDMQVAEESLAPISLENMKPGDVIEKTVDFQNAGSIDFGSLAMSLANVDDSNSLLSQLDVTIHFVSNVSTDQEAAVDFDSMKVSDIDSFQLINDAANNIIAGNGGSVMLVITVPSELENEYQGIGASFDLVFGAEQVK